MKPLEHKLHAITSGVLKSYRKHSETQRIGQTCLPSRAGIIDILDHIQYLLFPGYFGAKELTEENIRYHAGNLLVRVAKPLAEQIYNCLCRCELCKKSTCDCPKNAQEMAAAFLERIPALRTALALDAQAFYDGDPAARDIAEIIYCYPGFYAVMVYRIGHELLDIGVPLMPRMLGEHAHSKTGTDIHPGATIGKAFFIDHATGVVIGETTVIGNNVRIYQGVTLGARSFPKDASGKIIKGLKRHPTIKDNVTIYPNATILGGETVIGTGSTIGGNVYLTESVGPHSLVMQEKPQLQVLKKPSAKKKPSASGQ